jgi:hypothetical protein
MVIPRTKIVLRNPVVPMKILDPNILRVEDSINLIKTHHLRPIIMHEHYRLNHKPPLLAIARETFLPAGESALQATHSPLARLPKRCVGIADFQQIVLHVTMQMSCRPFSDGTDQGSVRVTTPGEPLVDADLIIPNFFLRRVQKSRRQCAVGPTPWEN